MSDLHKAYTILGLELGSSKDEIQKRYKRLAVAWHPDRFPTADGKADAEAELKKILNARDILIKHFDGGTHKPGACECGKATANSAQQSQTGSSGGKTAAAAQNAKGPSASASARPAQSNNKRAEPSDDQRRHWERLEREFEREEQTAEDIKQQELLERFFQQQKEAVPKPTLEPLRRRKKRTIADELQDSARGGKQPYGWPEKVADFFLDQLDECKLVVLSPLQYFEEMELEGGLRQPITFVSLIAVINGLAWLISGLGHPMSALIAAVGIIICSFAVAGATLLLSRPLGGTGDFEATYRACSAAMAPCVVLWMPMINVFAVLYSVMLLKLSLERAQELSATRSTTVVGIEVLAAVAIGIGSVLCGLAQLVGGSHR